MIGNDGTSSEVCKKYLGKDGVECIRKSFVELEWLRKNFEVVPDDVTEKELKYYVRTYVVFAIRHLIEPAAYRAYASLIYLHLLDNIDEIDSYSWGVYALIQLHHFFTKVKVGRKFDGTRFYFVAKVNQHLL